MFQHGPRAIVLQKSHFAKIGKKGRYGLSNCVTTVHVRNNSSSGLSNESIALSTLYHNEEGPLLIIILRQILYRKEEKLRIY